MKWWTNVDSDYYVIYRPVHYHKRLRTFDLEFRVQSSNQRREV